MNKNITQKIYSSCNSNNNIRLLIATLLIILIGQLLYTLYLSSGFTRIGILDNAAFIDSYYYWTTNNSYLNDIDYTRAILAPGILLHPFMLLLSIEQAVWVFDLTVYAYCICVLIVLCKQYNISNSKIALVLLLHLLLQPHMLLWGPVTLGLSIVTTVHILYMKKMFITCTLLLCIIPLISIPVAIASMTYMLALYKYKHYHLLSIQLIAFIAYYISMPQFIPTNAFNIFEYIGHILILILGSAVLIITMIIKRTKFNIQLLTVILIYSTYALLPLPYSFFVADTTIVKMFQLGLYLLPVYCLIIYNLKDNWLLLCTVCLLVPLSMLTLANHIGVVNVHNISNEEISKVKIYTNCSHAYVPTMIARIEDSTNIYDSYETHKNANTTVTTKPPISIPIYDHKFGVDIRIDEQAFDSLCQIN